MTMRIAALQFEARAGAVQENLGRVIEAAGTAAKGGAGLLIAPELCLPGYGAGDAFESLAEPLDGPLVAKLQDVCREAGIAIIAGFGERRGGEVANSAVFLDGERAVAYHKAFLYGPYEKRHFVPGKPENVIVEHGGLKIGILICYDVEFPENVRRLATAGVDLVAVPTALPGSPHAGFIAGSVVPVRAFENQVHVVYANLCGADGDFTYAGLSTVAAPDGRILASAGSGEELIFAEIDPAAFDASREENPYLGDLAAVMGKA
jgi:predicted amidohydrolase